MTSLREFPLCSECEAVAFGIYEVTRKTPKGNFVKRQRVLCASCGFTLPSKGEQHSMEKTEIVQTGQKEIEPLTLNIKPVYSTKQQYVTWRSYPIVSIKQVISLMDHDTMALARAMNNLEFEQNKGRRTGIIVKERATRASGPMGEAGSFDALFKTGTRV